MIYGLKVRWTPHPVTVTIEDSSNGDYIGVLLYSYYTTIQGGGSTFLGLEPQGMFGSHHCCKQKLLDSRGHVSKYYMDGLGFSF